MSYWKIENLKRTQRAGYDFKKWRERLVRIEGSKCLGNKGKLSQTEEGLVYPAQSLCAVGQQWGALE